MFRNRNRSRMRNGGNQFRFSALFLNVQNTLDAMGGTAITNTRASVTTCLGYLEAAVSGDAQVLLTVSANVTAFVGGRGIGNPVTSWSDTYADGTPLPVKPRPRWESGASNYCGNNTDVGGTGWANPSATLAASAVSCTGGGVYKRITEAAATSFHGTFYSLTLPATGNIVSSIYVKADTGTRKIQFRAYGMGSVGAYLNFDPATGTFGTIGAAVLNYDKIAQADGGWIIWACWNNTATATAQAVYIVQSLTSPEVESYLGDGTSSILVAWPQFEMGNVRTSLIKTTAGTMVRQPDAPTTTTTGRLSSTAGALAFEFVTPAVLDTATRHFIRNYSATEALEVYVAGTTLTFKKTTGGAAVSLTATIAASTTYKVALSYGALGMQLAVNNALASSNATVTGYTVQTALDLHNTTLTSHHLRGVVRLANKQPSTARLIGMTL